MTFVACLEGLLIRVALVYWAASFVVLLLRLVWRDFEQLAAYGGHGASLLNNKAPPTDGSNAAVSDKSTVTSVSTISSVVSFPMRCLRASPLGTVSVTRKQSFLSFYASGVATAVLLLVAHFTHAVQSSAASLTSAAVTAVPLLLFLLHCGVRFAETRYVQRFRPHDTVTLFAAVAGSTFYVMAAVSSAVPADVASPFSLHWLHHSRYLQCLFGAGVAAHVSVQALQVMVHTILAKLRRPRDATPAEELNALFNSREGVWRYVQQRLARRLRTRKGAGGKETDSGGGPLSLHGAWRAYRFPYASNPAFQLVLDPHYTCEVVLYTVNTALLLLCLLPDPRQLPEAYEPLGTVEESFLSSLSAPSFWLQVCVPAPWFSLLASAGVTLFTLVNLSITSAGHRRFWVACNVTRREVAKELEALLNSPLRLEENMPLPAELVEVAAGMLQGDVVEEVLPRWNIVPLVW